MPIQHATSLFVALLRPFGIARSIRAFDPWEFVAFRTMITFARKGRWEGDAGMKQLLSEAASTL